MFRNAAAAAPLLLVLAGSGLAQQAQPSLPDWARTGVCYEVFVRSFFDSDGDGVGDFRGLIQKLDYINDGDPGSQRDLGASCIWLMPIMQSPSYHGYDVTNYYQVNRDYGTNEDFRELVAEAHRRGIRIVVDLVLNHMSSEHPVFKDAQLDARSPYRDWFLWSPTQRRTAGWQAATWHRAESREEYYYGLFWRGMPDLNLANVAVAAEWKRVARYWLQDMDVDGFRLDAVGHFFEQGDEPRNGAGVHPFLRDYQSYLRGVKPGVFTVGEVWDSIGAIRAYYPDQLDAYFAFQVADSLLGAVRSGSSRGLLTVLERVQREYPRGRWASFQRNHDQTRTLTELRGDTARARLAATLLLTLPGVPFIYYGEEIGMTGDKPDPRLRTPMHWERQPAAGFTRGQAWEPLPRDSFTANVAVMDRDSGSLLNHYRRLVHLRTARPALGAAGEFVALTAGTDSVLAYLRRDGDAVVLVVANLTGTPRQGPQLRSAAAVLAPATWRATPLMGRAAESSLRIARDGRINGWAPAVSLAPFETMVLELSRP